MATQANFFISAPTAPSTAVAVAARTPGSTGQITEPKSKLSSQKVEVAEDARRGRGEEVAALTLQEVLHPGDGTLKHLDDL